MKKSKFRKIFAAALLLAIIGVVSILNVPQAKAADATSSVNVLSPNGGETINFSKVYSIKWNYSNLYQVSLALYRDGSFFNWIATNVSIPSADNAAASYDWTPSQTISEANISGSFKIYILGYKTAGGQIEDYSDAPFSIAATSTPSITILSPNGGEVWQVEHNYQIEFKIAEGKKGYVDLLVFPEGSEPNHIFNSFFSNIELGAGIFSSNWAIPQNVSTGKYIVKVYLKTLPVEGTVIGADTSNVPFSIVSAIIASDSDNSTDYNKTIISYLITLEKYPDLFTAGVGTGIYRSSPTYHLIYGLEPNPLTPKSTDKPYSTYYDHCVNSSQLNEAFVTSDGQLNSVSVSAPTGYICSNGAFIATPAASGGGGEGGSTLTSSITVLSPNGGENWEVGKTYNIAWKANGLEQVNINLFSADSVDKGSDSVASLASNLSASIGNYSWTVPEKTECRSLPCITLPEHRNHKIEVVDARYGRGSTVSKVYSDTSDAPFSIVAANSSVVSEQVKCVFNGAQTEQKCYAASPDNDNISCSGKESCVADIKRAKGESVTWKSTCGGYAYTIMDGENESAEFDCATVVAAPPKPGATPTDSPKPIETDIKIVDMKYNAKNIVDDKYDAILLELKQLRNTVKEQQNEIKYLKSMTDDLRNISDKMKSAINDFITYGVDSNTVKLGAGERAAVIHSYKSAFDKLPETEAELTDVIKIANGRFPSLFSDKAEKKAKEQFIKIYKRTADMNNVNDSAAIKVMTYGLRQKAENRNLNSEKSGIKIFRNIYGYMPKTTEDWNTMQAITYSGATR